MKEKVHLQRHTAGRGNHADLVWTTGGTAGGSWAWLVRELREAGQAVGNIAGG